MFNYNDAKRLVNSLMLYGIWHYAFIQTRQIAIALAFCDLTPKQRLTRVRCLNAEKLSDDYRKAIDNMVRDYVKECREQYRNGRFSDYDDLRKYNDLMVKIYHLAKVGAQEWPQWWEHPENEVWAIRQQIAILV